MKNKMLLAGLLLTMCLVFTGCGSDAVSESTPVSTVTVEETETSVEPESTVTEAVSVEEPEEIEEVEETKEYRIASETLIYHGEEYSTTPYEYDEEGRLKKVGTRVYEYDENGNAAIIYYYMDESCTQIWYKDLYEYDSENRKTKYTPIGYNMVTGEENVNDFETYEYDEEGRLSKVICYWGQIVVAYGEPYSEQKYVYDAEGRLSEIDYVDPGTDNINSRDIYEYDSNGNLVSVKTEELDGTISYEITYTYDSEGRETSCTSSYCWDDELETDTIERSEYDEEGRLWRVTIENVTYDYTESSVYEYELVE